MKNLAHVIAVVVGFILYMATKNILLAAVIAVAVEGVVFAIIILLSHITSSVKNSEEQFAAWQAGTAKAPPLKKLWWRIALIVLFGIIVIIGFIPLIQGPNSIEGPSNSFSGSEWILLIIICTPVVLSAMSLKKAIKWNETVKQPQSSDRSHVEESA